MGIFVPHFEQIRGWAVSLLLTGSETWFVIPDSYHKQAVAAIRDWLLDRGGEGFGLPPTSTSGHGGATAGTAGVTMGDAELLDFLFLSKRVNPPVGIYTQRGIPVYKIERQAGTMLIATGSSIHWGYPSANYSVARAVNVLPIQWLQRGLPEITHELQQRLRLLQRWAVITGHDDPSLKATARLAAAAAATGAAAAASASIISSGHSTCSRKRKLKSSRDHYDEALAAARTATQKEHRVRSEHVDGRVWVAGILQEKGNSV